MKVLFITLSFAFFVLTVAADCDDKDIITCPEATLYARIKKVCNTPSSWSSFWMTKRQAVCSNCCSEGCSDCYILKHCCVFA